MNSSTEKFNLIIPSRYVQGIGTLAIIPHEAQTRHSIIINVEHIKVNLIPYKREILTIMILKLVQESLSSVVE